MPHFWDKTEVLREPPHKAKDARISLLSFGSIAGCPEICTFGTSVLMSIMQDCSRASLGGYRSCPELNAQSRRSRLQGQGRAQCFCKDSLRINMSDLGAVLCARFAFLQLNLAENSYLVWEPVTKTPRPSNLGGRISISLGVYTRVALYAGAKSEVPKLLLLRCFALGQS